MQFFTLPALFKLTISGNGYVLIERGCPILPAVGGLERRGKVDAEGGILLCLMRLLFVKDTQKQYLGQLRDILHGTGAVGPAHDVADALDGGVDRLLGGQHLAVAVLFAVPCHVFIVLPRMPDAVRLRAVY